jgi:hypothetical protein
VRIQWDPKLVLRNKMVMKQPGFSGSMVVTEDGPSGNPHETSGLRMYLMWKEVQLMYLSPPGDDHYLVVRQSQLGEARSSFGCPTVPTGRDK